MTTLRRREDEGFALIFTLFVTTMVMIAVAATLVITTPGITGSQNSQNTSGALLAAESGIQDVVAYLTNIPACQSQTRICPQALGASGSDAQGNSTANPNRPALGNGQTFTWQTNSQAVPLTDSSGNVINSQGFVRVTSTGTDNGVSKILVADLSLSPSILTYGYYSNYESQTPTFLNSYWGARKIYVSNTTTYANINTSYTSRTSAPQTISWNGAGNSPPSGYSDSVCAQHWYSDGSSSPGRAATASAQGSSQAQWAEAGSLNGHTVYNVGSCDLVFTAGMIENGPTYTRDALDIANGTGSGPTFNAPVYTLWGYGSHTTPAPSSSQPWRQADGTGNDPLTNSPYKPQIASYDITLPSSIGTSGIEQNSCIYYGPTRVVLNGDGTATVASPEPTSVPSPTASPACYPSNLSGGIVNYTYNYNTTGSGTIYVKNLNTPSTNTWPPTTLKANSTPSAANTVFWIPDNSTVSADPSNASASSSLCSSTNAYSSSANATCSWSNIGTYPGSTLGWTAYSSTTACNKVTATTDEQYFQCEYNHIAPTSTSTPSTDGYAALRSALQSQLSSGTCVGGTTATQQTCIENAMDILLATANTGQHAYNYASPANGDHQYYVAPAASTPIGSAGSATSNLTPTPGDSLFSFTGTPGQEKSTSTPLNFTVYRQTYNSTTKTWSTGSSQIPQFSFTVVETSWSVTSQPNGHDYFPNVQDVTPYAMGSTSAGSAAGTTGADQPGDLYVQGVNQGSLSLIAQNNVEITGNITKGAGQDTSTSNPVSITAGNDIRNYHPVSCADQNTTDITNTTAGWCPNDITGIYSGTLLNTNGSFTASHPAAQYVDMPTSSSNSSGIGDRTVDAVLFSLNGSLRTDNYNRGNYVGKLIVNGGIYEDYRGANGVNYANGSNTPGQAGTSLNYTWVDLEHANLQYVPSASYSNNPRVWNVVSMSDGN